MREHPGRRAARCTGDGPSGQPRSQEQSGLMPAWIPVQANGGYEKPGYEHRTLVGEPADQIPQ